MPRLTPAESRLDERSLDALLQEGGWKREGEVLSRTYRRAGWQDAIAFVDRIALAASELDHHPDIHIERYRNVRVTTTTFATGRLSDADVALARKIDAIASAPAAGA